VSTEVAPSTDKALYERLRRMFGVGDYNENGDQPYFEYQRQEAGKMKRWRIARKLSLLDLWLAAQFCKATKVTVITPFDLTRHITVAKRWAKAAELAAERANLDDQVIAAVTRERTFARDGDWVGRLLRAQGDGRKEVLATWESSLSSTITDQGSIV
jgi:hypothetical protein